MSRVVPCKTAPASPPCSSPPRPWSPTSPRRARKTTTMTTRTTAWAAAWEAWAWAAWVAWVAWAAWGWTCNFGLRQQSCRFVFNGAEASSFCGTSNHCRIEDKAGAWLPHSKRKEHHEDSTSRRPRRRGTDRGGREDGGRHRVARYGQGEAAARPGHLGRPRQAAR